MPYDDKNADNLFPRSPTNEELRSRVENHKKITVKVKKLYPDAILPTKAHDTDAGWDLYWHRRSDRNGMGVPVIVIDTGIAFEIPVGYECQIRPRSGLAAKYGVSIVNSPGTIDCSYRGEIRVILSVPRDLLGYFFLHVGPGARIAQAVFQKLPDIELVEVDELSDTKRGTGGFGSSGL